MECTAAGMRSVLRGLLRAVDTHITSVAQNKQWRVYVLQEARRLEAEGDTAAVSQSVQLAKEYTDLINGIAHHRELLQRYNIGVDPEERNKRMVEATARRVGFALPDALGRQQALGAMQDQDNSSRQP